MKLNWLQKIERGMFPRGPEYTSKRKTKHDDGSPVCTYEPSGNARQRRKERRRYKKWSTVKKELGL